MYQTPVESRPENASPNFHLHMHHLCPCLNMVYPYCPPPAYRPAPICYTQNRPYNLHHYQYTQYNMIPYATPAAILSPQVLAVSATSHLNNANSEVAFGPPPRDRRNVERAGNTENQENATIEEKQEQAPAASNEDAAASQEVQEVSNPCSSSENFVKFLEESCMRAEQIAYRNRNRPCFRNIQNLCMRTRSEILKPCTTISNIHSQGIPWATKDFIYAFIRLINCWHILKGYLEKDGGLGKIEKELSADFKQCYCKWEKDSMQLAEQLRKIFCNLDATISGNSQHNQDANQSQMNRSTNDASTSAQASCNGAISKEPKGSKGECAHILSTSSEQINFCDSCSSSAKEDDSGSDSRIYMKPGSYNVPKKNGSSNNSPRSFEFLETAQNTHIRKSKEKTDTVDKIWQNAQTAAPTLISKINPIGFEKSLEVKEDAGAQDLFPGGTDVQTWINTGLYPILTETKQQQTLNGPKNVNITNSSIQQKPITVLQRSRSVLLDVCKNAELLDAPKNASKDVFQKPYKKAAIDNCSESTQSKSSNSRLEIPSRTYRKRVETSDSKGAYGNKKMKDEEEHGTDMTNETITKVKEILDGLKTTAFGAYLPQIRYSQENECEFKYPSSLGTIIKKMETKNYKCLNEVVEDFSSVMCNASCFFKDEEKIMLEWAEFVMLFKNSMSAAFPEFNFDRITSDYSVGAVGLEYNHKKSANRDGDGDH